MKYVSIFLFLFFFESGFSQEIKNDSIYQAKDLDVKAEYAAGTPAFFKFIGTNFKVPEKPAIRAKVIVQFVVETDGTLSNFNVKRDPGYGTAEEAIRVLKTSPVWKPGKKDGKAVRSLYALPITISNG